MPYAFPTAAAADDYMSGLAASIIEDIATGLILHQPDRPSAFTKAFALGTSYEGDVRGGGTFSQESSYMYLKVLAGPILAELMERLLSMPADQRPSNKAALLAWIAKNIDSIGEKVDAASVRISSCVKGKVARKRVEAMKADPTLREKAHAAAASGAYTSGGSGKAKARAARAQGGKGSGSSSSSGVASGGVLGEDTNVSTVGRGVESQVSVDEAEFAKYMQQQADAQRAAVAATAAAEEAAAAVTATPSTEAVVEAVVGAATAEVVAPAVEVATETAVVAAAAAVVPVVVPEAAPVVTEPVVVEVVAPVAAAAEAAPDAETEQVAPAPSPPPPAAEEAATVAAEPTAASEAPATTE